MSSRVCFWCSIVCIWCSRACILVYLLHPLLSPILYLLYLVLEGLYSPDVPLCLSLQDLDANNMLSTFLSSNLKGEVFDL